MKKQDIIVLDFFEGAMKIHTVDTTGIEDIEEYLVNELGYKTDNIEYMVCPDTRYSDAIAVALNPLELEMDTSKDGEVRMKELEQTCFILNTIIC